MVMAIPEEQATHRPRWWLVGTLTFLGCITLVVAASVSDDFLANVAVEIGGTLLLFGALALLQPTLLRQIARAATPQKSLAEVESDLRHLNRPSPGTTLSTAIRDLAERLLNLGFRQDHAVSPNEIRFVARHGDVSWELRWDEDWLEQTVLRGSTRLTTHRTVLRYASGRVLTDMTTLKIRQAEEVGVRAIHREVVP